jgi:hypothetical protein
VCGVALGCGNKPKPGSAPTIGALTGDLQQRQGGGGTLIVTGTNLAGITSATVGDLTAAVQSDNDTTATLVVAVPHAHATGDLPLTIATDGGTVTKTSAVTITPITVATTGDDSAAGTTAAPYASISVALAASRTGDTISLAGGTFTPADAPLLVSDVDLEGNGSTISGPAGVDGLIVSGTTTLHQLMVSGFATGVIVTGGTATLDTVTITGGGDGGLAASGATTNVTVQGGGLTQNGLLGAGDGVDARDGATVTLSGTHLAANQGCGASVANAAHLKVTGAIIEQNFTCGLLVVESPASIDAENDTFSSQPIHIFDARPSRSAPDGPIIELTGSMVGDTAFVMGTHAAGPISNLPYWQIVNSNNRLAFEPATWP